MSKDLSKEGALMLVEERRNGFYSSVQNLATQTSLNKGELESLADSDALKDISNDRHRAYWQVLDSTATSPLFPIPKIEDTDVMLRKPREGENILADYASTGLSLRRHPLALLRKRLDQRGATIAAGLWKLNNDARAKAAGIVTSRQRPGTASGVMFFTLEDETGFINAVIWPAIFEKQRHILLKTECLEITGKVQQQDGVLHLIAVQCADLSTWLGEMSLKSRNFH